jgi:hypothetical protein
MQDTFNIAELWPSVNEFAEDLGISLSTVRVWKHRRSIPHLYWSAVEQKARERRIKGASCSVLAKIAAHEIFGEIK